jgi:excisionase family DNA binding protein
MAENAALLTSREVADLLRVHPKQVYRLLRRGLPARRVGAEWRFDRGDVLAWSGAERPRAAAPLPSPPGAPPSLVAANGDVVVALLLRAANALGAPLLGFVQTDLARAIALLEQDAVLAAGAHAGGFPSHVGGDRAARVHLASREVGLLFRRSAGTPRLADLRRLRFASRPPTAGVRKLLDGALRAGRLDPEAAHRRAVLHDSHLDVALEVASGRADVGLGSRAWGERAGLAFAPVATEDYGLIVKARDLGDPRVVRICEVAQGRHFRETAAAEAGYDTRGAGDIRYDA